jgi:NOL1/NOP2/sun family putative RNA methylase
MAPALSSEQSLSVIGTVRQLLWYIPRMTTLPTAFLERLERILSSEDLASVLPLFQQPRLITFRLNRLKAQPDELFQKLSQNSFETQPVSWYDDASILAKGTLRELQQTAVYQEGHLYIQELSSMVPVLLLAPQPGEKVLDLTAAPGSKTGQMASLMKNTGKILANDVSRTRFFKMKANLEALGVQNVEYSVAKGENIGRRLAGQFDRVLLDAPCSGEGRFHLSDPESFSNWKTSKMKGLVPRQKMLFYSAWQALKPGGTLVYSTCTYAPEENEGILDWAIEKFKDLEVLPADLKISNRREGIAQWGKHSFDPAVKKALRIIPDGKMEGFFVAKMMKKSSVVSL